MFNKCEWKVRFNKANSVHTVVDFSLICYTLNTWIYKMVVRRLLHNFTKLSETCIYSMALRRITDHQLNKETPKTNSFLGAKEIEQISHLCFVVDKLVLYNKINQA